MDNNVEQPVTILLATRIDRFFAALVDGFILILILIVPQFLIFGLDGLARMQSENEFTYALATGAVSQIVFLLLNGRLLFKYGQTIGKRYLEIKIVDLNNNLPTAGSVYGRRYLLMGLFYLIPGLGGIFGLVDPLFIFREDRRCIHDLIAGTKVIAA